MDAVSFNRAAAGRIWRVVTLPTHLRQLWRRNDHAGFANAIQRLQRYHGLGNDGKLGRQTSTRLLNAGWLRQFPIRGKGLFIWRLEHIRDVPRAIARFAAGGMRHALIKCADGRMPMNAGIRTWRRSFERRQISLFPWVYPYCYANEAALRQAAQLHIQQARGLGARAIVVNAEAGFKRVQRVNRRRVVRPTYRQQATLYMRMLRDAGLVVYLSSYCFANQRDFPYRELASGANVLAPQSYWSLKRMTPPACMDRSVNEWRGFAPRRPVIPAGGCHQWRANRGPWRTDYHPAAEITTFIQQCNLLRLPHATFWLYTERELDEERLSQAQWQALAGTCFWS